MLLKELHIEDRATVFEENSVRFFARFFSLKRKLPAGHRATWADRGKLAAAKLCARLCSAGQDDQFTRVMLSAAPFSDDPDFIEVHIYGPLHRRNIDKVVVTGSSRHQRSIVRELQKVLREIGVEVQVG
jgi:hypothetical protein